MKDIKLVCVTACFYPTTQPIWMLANSARHFDIPLYIFGLNDPNNNWIHIKIDEMIKAAMDLKSQGYTHMLYTDGRDSFFVDGLKATLNIYEEMRHPMMLMAAETNSWPMPNHMVDHVIPSPWGECYRYPCAGQFIAELDWLIDRYSFLKETYTVLHQDNDQMWIQMGLIDRILPGFKLDHYSDIFQSMGGLDSTHVQIVPVEDERAFLFNSFTNSMPGVVHFNGGYTDPKTGKEDRMIEMYRALGLPE